MPKTFKAELTVPTEQFGNIRPQVEGTAQEIVDAYFEFSRMVKPKEGLNEKNFNIFLDKYLMGEKNHVEEYQEMSPKQQEVVQIIKRSLARIKSRQK